MSSSKKIFNGFFWSLIVNILNAFYGFISVPLLLLHFGKEQFGIIGLTTSINVYLRLMDMGLSSGNIKFFSDYIVKKESNKIIKLLQSSLVLYTIIGILNFLILLVLSFYCGEIFKLDFAQELILKKLIYILMITSLGSWISSAFEQYIRANDFIGWHQRIIILPKILQILLLIIIINFNLSIVQFFTIQSLSTLIVLPIFIFKLKKINPLISIQLKYDHQIFKKVLIYSIGIFSFSIFQFSANYLRPLILGIKIGLESVAEYRIIEGFANLVMMLGVSFVGVILPTAAKVIVLNDKKKELQIAYDGTLYISTFLSITVFGFILVSKDLLNLYVGKEYLTLTVWLNLWVLTLLGTHNSALSSLVLSNDNLKPIVLMSAFSTVISLISAWFLTAYFSIGGVIIGYSLYVICQLLFYYLYYYPKIMGYDSYILFTNTFLKPVVIIGVIFLTINYCGSPFLTQFNGILRIFTLEIFFLIITIPVTYFFILEKKDKLFFYNILFKQK
jgi:O-antigen/teichoic acid export membrane protein